MLYRHHCASNLTLGILLAVSLSAFHFDTSTRMVFAVSFILATFLLSPDLDLHHSSPSRNWGWMKKMWWPYSKIFRHRGLSHIPLIGTGTRLAYLIALACLGVLAVDVFHALNTDHAMNMRLVEDLASRRMHDGMSYWNQNETLCLSAVAGVSASDIAHLLVDKIGSFFKLTHSR